MAGLSILPVARAMLGHYSDLLTAQRVVHELVKAGTGRHNIAIYPADAEGVNSGKIDVNQPEKILDTYKEVESPHGYLVVAWVIKSRRKRAAQIMTNYPHQGFKDVRSWWASGGTPFELFDKDKPNFN